MKYKYRQLLLCALTPLCINTTSFASTEPIKACEQFGWSSCPPPFDGTLPKPKNMLNWDQDSRVIGFRNTYRLYDGDVFKTLGAKPYPLPIAEKNLPAIEYRIDNQNLNLDDYLQNQSITGLLILKDGEINYEYYGKGNTPQTLWTSRSVAKSVVSVLVGIAIKDGLIDSVDDKISRYIPELADSEWRDVSLHQLLQHTSGVDWNEDYADPKSDFAAMTLCEAKPAPYDCVLTLVKSVTRKANNKPGEVWSYNTGGAWLVGLLLERATAMPIAHYLEKRLWSRFGMESDGVWHSYIKNKTDMGGHGFNATLRDWGRVGLFVSLGGKLASGEQLLPTNWMTQSTTWAKAKGSVVPYAPNGQYGYQWWVDPLAATEPKGMPAAKQTFWAYGIYGQSIAINVADNLIIVQWSTWEQASSSDALYNEQALFFKAVSAALKKQ